MPSLIGFGASWKTLRLASTSQIIRNADASDLWYVGHSAGLSAVATFDPIIREEALRQKVDPNLVRAIVFAEAARGHYFGAAKAAEGIGAAKTYFPMNINPTIWSGLGLDDRAVLDPRMNIRAGVTLIRRLGERLDDPSPEKTGTLYNFAGRDTVSDYGAYIGRIYREEPWSRP